MDNTEAFAPGTIVLLTGQNHHASMPYIYVRIERPDYPKWQVASSPVRKVGDLFEPSHMSDSEVRAMIAEGDAIVVHDPAAPDKPAEAPALIGPLTAEEWCSLRLGGLGDDDPLYCCTVTSSMRDFLFEMLRMGAGREWSGAFRQAFSDLDAACQVEHPLIEKLRAYYVADAPAVPGE